MHRKQIKSSRYFAAFFLTIIIFLVGFIIGEYISEQKLRLIYGLEQDLRIESLGNEMLFELVTEDLCENINLTSYTDEVSSIGTKLTYMEGIYGYNAPQVWSLKNYYSLLLIRHWLLAAEAKDVCKIEKPLVMYFYTNKNCVDCEDQGLVLTNVHRNYPFFYIYSFEVALDNAALNFLREKYDIQENRLPTLVIDEKVFYGFQSKDFLMEYMDLKRLLAEDKKQHPSWYS